MLKNIVAITGVTKGLGLAIVNEFASRGWKIAGCGRSTKVIQELQRKYGPDHVFSVVDIADDDAVAGWAAEVSEKMGPPAMVINNAALINHPNVLWKVPPSEFSDIMNTNVMGTFHVLRHFIPLMHQGVIVNVTSGWGVEGASMFSPYCASKFAIEGLTQSLAGELPKGFIVVALDPGGGINTGMLKKAFQEEANQFPTAVERAKTLVPFLLNLKAEDTGRHLIVPH